MFTATDSSEYVSAAISSSEEEYVFDVASSLEEYVSDIAGSLKGEYMSSTIGFPDEKYASNASSPPGESSLSSIIKTGIFYLII